MGGLTPRTWGIKGFVDPRQREVPLGELADFSMNEGLTPASSDTCLFFREKRGAAWSLTAYPTHLNIPLHQGINKTSF